MVSNRVIQKKGRIPTPNRKPYQPSVERRIEVVDRLQGKQSKEESSYRFAPIDSEVNCAACSYYLKPGQSASPCSKVAGIVNGNDVCDLYESRRNGS